MNNTTLIAFEEKVDDHIVEHGDFWPIWKSYGVIIVAIPIILVNVVGNTLTIISFIIDVHLRSCNANIYIVNMAIADLGIGLVTLPVLLYTTVTDFIWVLGEIPCKISLAYNRWLKTVSNISLIFISYDRMLMIRDGENYDHHVVRKKAIRYIVQLWLYSFLFHFSIIFSFERIWQGGSVLEKQVCYLKFHGGKDTIKSPVPLILAALELAYPIVCLATFCTMLVVAIIKRGKSLRNVNSEFENILLDKERKLCWCLCIMVALYAILWTPYTLSILLRMICNDCITVEITAYLKWWLWLHTAMNPFHYAHADPRFAAHFKHMLCTCFCFCLHRKTAPPSHPSVSAIDVTVEPAPDSRLLSRHRKHYDDALGSALSSQYSTIIATHVHQHSDTDIAGTPAGSPTRSPGGTPKPPQKYAPHHLHPYAVPHHTGNALQVPGLSPRPHSQHHVRTEQSGHYHPSHHIVDMVEYELSEQRSKSRMNISGNHSAHHVPHRSSVSHIAHALTDEDVHEVDEQSDKQDESSTTVNAHGADEHSDTSEHKQTESNARVILDSND